MHRNKSRMTKPKIPGSKGQLWCSDVIPIKGNVNSNPLTDDTNRL